MALGNLKHAAILLLVLISGCAATSHPDFQNVYRKVEIPLVLVNLISGEFKSNNLVGASISRDNVGRIILSGAYENEDEVDQAFAIVHSIVGEKSTSPVFPTNVRVKKWEKEASSALDKFFKNKKQEKSSNLSAERYAIVIGVSKFRDGILPTEGAYDARLFANTLMNSGIYKRENISLLIDERATKSAIESVLREHRAKLRDTDSIMIFVSSHGKLLPAAESTNEKPVKKMRIVAHDSSAKNAVALLKTSVSDEELIGFVGLNLREVTIILDTCDSGDAFAAFHKFSPGGRTSENFIRNANGGTLDRVGLSTTTLANRWLGAKDIELDNRGLASKDIFVDLGKVDGGRGRLGVTPIPRGVILMSASGPREKSYNLNAGSGSSIVLPSGRAMQRGSLFTVGLLDSLQLHENRIDPSFLQARKFVSERVQSLEPGATQTPHMVKSPHSRLRFFE